MYSADDIVDSEEKRPWVTPKNIYDIEEERWNGLITVEALEFFWMSSCNRRSCIAEGPMSPILSGTFFGGCGGGLGTDLRLHEGRALMLQALFIHSIL
ncbi:unnamed protein product [Allacma fusca]|uniref:Uncharacterized protein n=1 Tax=Allacma fusca TaxID=39272 RepID=A0A8J2NVJ4_9HEXA|nr:unnamed protein product [Allacma fusca]